MKINQFNLIFKSPVTNMDYSKRSQWAFTLLELLVVVAIIGILASLLLSVIASSKLKSSTVRCISNFKQLQAAWLMYTTDFNHLPPNNDQPYAGKSAEFPSWVAGWLRLDNETGDKSDSTNVSLLIGKEYAPFGSIGPYTQSASVYKCALDRSTVNINGIDYPRVRTVAMNSYMNGSGIWQNSNYVTFRKLVEIPNPANTWVFIEEREDSINDGYFAVMVDSKYTIIDVPANYHNNGAIVSFSDGHVEYHKWLEATTTPPLIRGIHLSGVPIITSPKDRDLEWLIKRTTIER
jgi:prepilin-type N-terminal cleavage/methylation domain-containing protein/prepilin-type processing-associated H-X9-DG protein